MEKIEKALEMLKGKGDYTQTDLNLYTDLSAGKIKVALSNNDPAYRFPIYNLIELKDSSLGAEIEKRYDTLEGKSYSSTLERAYDESIEEIILATLDATMFGVGVVEAYLDDDARLRFRRIEKEYFFFEDKKLYLQNANGKKFAPIAPKFFVFQRKAKLLKLLWIIFAKHFVLSHYLKFVEFLGVPPIVVNASNSDKETISAISQGLKGFKSGSFAIFGKEDAINVLEGRGSQADFMSFVSYVDNEIAKTINGSTLSSNAGKSGSYALGKVHEANRYEITAKDAKVASRAIAKVFGAFGISAEVLILVEKDKDLYQRAQTFQIVAGQGYSMTPEQIAKEFDLPIPANNKVLNKKVLNEKRYLGHTALEPKDGFAIHGAVKNKNAKKADMPMDAFDAFTPPKEIEEEMLGALEMIFKDASTYEEAFEQLLKAYPHFKLETLETVMMNALANSSLFGSVDE